MQLKFLGTGGYHPNERRHTACIMLPEAGIILDAGTSAFRISNHIETETLDIFLSHAHLDHIVGLTYLLMPILTGEVKTITLHGNVDVLKAIKKHLYAESLFPVSPPFEFCELQEGQSYTKNNIEVVHFNLLNHPGGSTAFRVNWFDKSNTQRSLAYVTDTIVDGTYTDFITGVDVLIHECYFSDDNLEWAEKTGHSYASAVALIAKEAQVGQLFLTHIDPQNSTDDPVGIDAMKNIFPNTHLAEDHTTVMI